MAEKIDEKGLAPRLNRWSNISPSDYFDQCYTPEPNSGCWLWLGTAYRTNRSGAPRPVMWIGGRRQYAYQFSHERFVGPIPSGHQICHRCNMPLCVNPQHIYAGTSLDNNRDAIRAGTHVSQRSDEFTKRGRDNIASMAIEGVFRDGRRVVFGSQGEAGRAGFNPNAISDCIHGRRNRHRGAVWRPLPAPPIAMIDAAGGGGEMSESQDLYSKIRRTNAAYFGLMGGIDMAENCPLAHGKCAPDKGDGCPHFMGHLFRGDQAYVGDRTPICCAILLRRLLATEPAHD